jgi:HEAT repeat protein
VRDASVRAQACRVCLTDGRPEAWVVSLARRNPPYMEGLRSALTDEDWRVRWASVRADAKARGVSEAQSLAEWVASAAPSAELPACLTATRAAAEAGQPPADFLKGAGPKAGAATARMGARREAVRQALEVELYAEKVSERGAALAHLATFLGRPPARVVLDAMASRPESVDEAVALALLDVAGREGASVGRMLLAVAKPIDEARVNRLFAVYSRELEALQPELTSADLTRRRVAVLSLKRYGPLASKELTRALGDADRTVRRHAARGVAEAEGLSVVEAARKLLRAEADLAALRPWLEAVAREKDGAALLLSVVEDRNRSPDVRGEAVARLGECEEGTRAQRFERLSPFFLDAEPQVRAGAVRALGAMPRGSEAADALSLALEDEAPVVQVAALEGVASLRQTSRAEAVATLLGSASPEVRTAAARALEFVGRAPQVKALAACLKGDGVASVRVAAARSLGAMGGPQAASALTEALQRDSDTHVQHVAREALQRLGFGQR